MGHFFDNMLLLAILYLVGFILFLAAYLTLKDFSGQPPVKKDNQVDSSSSPGLKEGVRALPPTNADWAYCPLPPFLADYCNCANGQSLGEYTPRRVR